MRHFLISVLLLGLVAGCSSVKIGPHRIDVQQGNALDQENVARLKLGLNRSQVRFLLGTPLVVDPFHTDRWDYVYVYYKAGKLAEQKRITLFFEGDTLARIEGDLPEPVARPAVPAAEPSPEPQSAPAAPVAPPPARASRASEPVAPVTPPVAAEPPRPPAVVAPSAPATAAAEPVPTPAASVPAAPAVSAPVQPAATKTVPVPSRNTVETSVVAPLPSPKNVPAYVDPRPAAELSLQPATSIAQIQPDVIPPFPDPYPAAGGSDDPVLKSVNEWVAAWQRRDMDAYLAAYDDSFTPQGGGSREDWEKRRRKLFDVVKKIEVKIDSPSFKRTEEGTVIVTFNQFYRSDNYRDAVIKQLLLVERGGRWLIAEEDVLSVLRGSRP